MKSSKLLSLTFAAALCMMVFQAEAGAPPVREGSGSWAFAPNSGVSAMHMVQSGPTKIVIIDKAEKNPDAKRKNGLYGFSVEYDLTKTTNPAYRVLDLETNTFCSAGSYLGNGTLVETGGSDADPTLTKVTSGYQTVRLWQPCTNNRCNWVEHPLYLASPRWYNSMVTLPDGRVFILGGCTKATSIDTKAYMNPTYEFFPGKKGAPRAPFSFLTKAFPYDLYPHVHVLPYGNQLFLFGNVHSAIWDYARETFVNDNIENLNGPPRTYPLTGTGVLLPLTYRNNYKPEFMVCGGGTKYGNVKSVADNTCGRIDLSVKNPKWDYDTFVLPRTMGDAVILPDGNVIIVNGGGIGYAGYTKGSAPNYKYLSDNPVLTPLLYNPSAKKGNRWTKLARSTVPRLYHSVSTLLPDGRVMVTGSNPNGNYRAPSKDLKYPTEYRVEMYTPYYLQNGVPRSTILEFAGTTAFNQVNPVRLGYGRTFTVKFRLSVTPAIGDLKVAFINLGFQTHSMHMSQRYVELKLSQLHKAGNGEYLINVETPPRSNVMPPTRVYFFLVYRGTPAKTACEVLLG